MDRIVLGPHAVKAHQINAFGALHFLGDPVLRGHGAILRCTLGQICRSQRVVLWQRAGHILCMYICDYFQVGHHDGTLPVERLSYGPNYVYRKGQKWDYITNKRAGEPG